MSKYVRIYPVDNKRHFRRSHTAPNGVTFLVDAGWTKVDDDFAAELAIEVNKAEDPDSAKVFEIKDEATFENDRNAQLHKLAMAQMAAASTAVDSVGAVKDITTKSAAASDFVAKRKGRPKKDAAKVEAEDSDEESDE